MKLFLIHIPIKDLSFMIFYFVIMKYNLTNETYLPETISNFPGAPKMTFGNMISASLFYNIIPLLISFVLYYPIVYLMRKLFKAKSTLSLTVTAFILTSTTPILYLLFSNLSLNDLKTAEIIAWILCFILSILTYIALNKFNRSNITKNLRSDK